MKKLYTPILFGLLVSVIVACNESSDENGTNNPGQTVPDSMPVVNPGITDTSRVLTPPPTNDEINALPDTIR